MELWHIYQFVKYIKANGQIDAYPKLLADYRQKHGLENQEMNDLWEIATGEHFIIVDSNSLTRLLLKGRKLTEMRGYGFLVAVIKEYGGPIVLLAGIASIINLVVIIVQSQSNH